MGNSRGYTLIEVLVAMVISAFVLALLVRVFGMHISYFYGEYERVVAQQTAKNLHLDLLRSIRENGARVVCSGYCLETGNTVYEISGTSLFANGKKVAEVDTGQDVPFKDSGLVEVRFDILYKKERLPFHIQVAERVSTE